MSGKTVRVEDNTDEAADMIVTILTEHGIDEDNIEVDTDE